MGASVPTVKHANLFEPEDDSRISVTGCVLFKQPVSRNRPLTHLTQLQMCQRTVP